MQKPHFFSLGGSQGDHKRLREAPKRHLKSFKISKRVPKIDPKQIISWVSFGAQSRTKMDPKMEPELYLKLKQTKVTVALHAKGEG